MNNTRDITLIGVGQMVANRCFKPHSGKQLQQLIENAAYSIHPSSEIVKLKAFGLREPTLSKALEELACILEKDVLVKIEDIVEQAVRDFGFERYAD